MVKEKKEPKEKVVKGKKVEEEEEEDPVAVFEHDGKKYLKSTNSGIIYDYELFKKEGDAVMIGVWNDKEEKINFKEDELSDEEYD